MPRSTPVPPTATPGPSPTLTITPTITSTPTQVPTATPVPEVRVNAGEKAIFDGNYPFARQEFQAVISSSSDEIVLRRAIWDLAKTDFLSDDFPAALESLRTLTQNYSNSEDGVKGWFLLGETYYALKRYQEAANSYQNYQTSRPGLLDTYVEGKRGDALTAVGDYTNALQAYQKAEAAAGDVDAMTLRIKIGDTNLISGDPASALKIFDEIYASTSNDYLKAQMDLLSGRALIALNKSDDGYARWRHAVDNYPLAYDSYSALVGLVEANQSVDEFNRGLVDYYAQKYDVALRAFQNYASSNPNHDGTVLHYMALTLREMGDFNSAINLWDTLISNYPGNRYWASAWDEKAFTQWANLNEYESAASGLEKFADETSGSPFALTYLMDAARIYERAGNLDKAATLWESLPSRFESNTSIGDAWFQAGIVRYRQGDYPSSNKDFQQGLLLAKEPSDRARALLWIGKTYSKGSDLKNAASAWEQAIAADPGNYYSLRARELLDNQDPFYIPPTTNLKYDLVAERAEAASWVRIKFNLPADTNLSDVGDLQSDKRFLRGTEFWNLGLYDEARLEFEDLRNSLKTNPVNSFKFGNYLLDIGAYRSAIYCLREVLTMAGLDDHAASLTAPIYFKHVRYGLYYSDLVWSAADDNKFDPLFVTSVIRQESLFEGFVHSTAGARGLMQIIPSTGASIAQQLGWPPNFTPDDLYSPYISIRLGTDYLNSNRQLLTNDLYATLAAYNGGPGNASIWQDLAKGDLDLELEVIRYGETRDYIRSIFETYSVYRGLYSPAQ